MDISKATGYPPSGNDRKSGSFTDSMREEVIGVPAPRSLTVSMRSFQANDLATGLAFVSPDFMPSSGEGMLDAIALGKGATDEMRRYEELTKYR